ncbi:MAG: enoyl-CoA hydratase/isomerase family protein [Candidatus Dormibacterales bacterium]
MSGRPGTLDVAREGAVAWVVMHRGGNNAMAPDIAGELEEAFAGLGTDPEVRAVVLKSAYERHFSVGADLSAMAAVDRGAEGAEKAIAAMSAAMSASFTAVERCPKPVIAAIAGHALGAGCELALCCDYRLMANDGRATIGLTEASLGIMPGAGGTQRLPRLIGRGRALPLLLEGRRLLAPEAEAIGLVHRALPAADLEGAAAELAGRLSRAATRALALIKEAVVEGLDMTLEEGLRLEARNFARASLTEDAAVGVMSFLAKQAPTFKGR